MIFSFLDQDKAVIQNEFQYKNCCKDEQGSSGNFIFLLFSFICKGLSKINSTKLDPKTCSERLCHSSEYVLYATWISSKVTQHL